MPRTQLLCADALRDLNAWVAEKGVLGIRAAQTLGAHYRRALHQHEDRTLIAALREQLGDSHTPPALRLELADVLDGLHLLDRPLQEKLLDPMYPAPLRLLAAERLLAEGAHPGAVATLRAVARLPNREMALATADVVQRCLGVDLGLPLGQALPPLQSRQAAEVTRRVMLWASQGEQPDNHSMSEVLLR